MRRDDASGNGDRNVRPALSEEEEHIRTSPQRTEALLADHGLKIEYRLIKFTRAIDFRDVDAGFDDSIYPRIRALDCLIISNSNNATCGWKGVNGAANQYLETNGIGK